jgi:hypothetical protein
MRSTFAEHGIIMLSFPPHSTHKMQPLDVGIYGLLKAKLKTAFNDLILGNPRKPITIYDVAKLSCEPYLLSFTPSNIIKAFQKPGIWPINRLAFDDTDFTGVLQYENKDQTVTDEPEDRSPTPGPSSSNLVRRIKIISNEIIKRADITDAPTSIEIVAQLIDYVLSRVFIEIEINLQTIQELQFEVPNLQVQKLSAKKEQKAEGLSPEVVRPFPKLKTRTENTRGRKRGSSRIYTNTPEKNEIDIKTQNKKKESAKFSGVVRNVMGGKAVAKVGAKSSKRQFSSDSEESAEEQCKHKYKKGVKKDGKEGAFSDSEENDEEQCIRKICVDSDLDMDFDEDNLPDELLDNESVSVGDFVLVRFSTKKKVLYFVGHVQELLDCDEYLVKFLRRKEIIAS